MSNQDSSKSLFLCLKILKKVIPKIAVPDSKQNKSDQSDAGKKLSEIKNQSNKTEDNLLIKSSEQPSNILEKEEAETIDEKSDESVINEVLNEIITIIEAKENPHDNLAPVPPVPVTETLSPLKKNSKIAVKTIDEKSNEVTVENCIFHLKELTHTFIKSHLFKIECNDENDNANTNPEEIVNKSFTSLFYSNQIKSLLSLNDDGYLIDDCDEYFRQKNTDKMAKTTQDQADSQLEDTIAQLQNLMLNEKIPLNHSYNSLSNVYSIQMRNDCLNYLQSFQILNRLLIKMFFFPREQKLAQCNEYDSDEEDSSGNNFLSVSNIKHFTSFVIVV
jgi:hypothetical protein